MTHPTSSQPTAAQSLAQFICDLSYRHVPADAVSRCRELLLDQLGCQMFGETKPARTTIIVAGIPLKDARIEIDAVAYKPR